MVDHKKFPGRKGLRFPCFAVKWMDKTYIIDSLDHMDRSA